MKLKTTLICLLAGARLMAGGLTDTEADSLQFMREEEKLARDVYLALYDVYGDAPFTNIARSEQRHMDSVLTVMELYGIADPALAGPGEFTNPDLQDLYDTLMAKGMESRAAAFQVGILVEETDIADLDEALESTENPDLIRVFSNLRRGSENHLSAFTRALATEVGFDGADYVDGWFKTWMGWRRLDTHPWVQNSEGKWEYHVGNPDGGRYVGSTNGSWYWTHESLYPWCYDMTAKRWPHGVPVP
jgi:hypothetical protein